MSVVLLCCRAGLVVSLRCMEYWLHHIWTVHWTHYVSGYCHKSYDSLWCGLLFTFCVIIDYILTLLSFIFMFLWSFFSLLILSMYFSRDVPDIRFRLAGYPAIFGYPVPVPAKILAVAGYCSRIIYLFKGAKKRYFRESKQKQTNVNKTQCNNFLM